MILEEENYEVKGLILRGGKRAGGHFVFGWRVFKPFIEKDKCRKCWFCFMYCPEGAITKGEEGAIIDYRFCKGCGICAVECPFGAIKMVKEE